MKLKVLFLLLAVVTLCAVFVSCGGSDVPDQTDSTSVSTEENSTHTSADEPDGAVIVAYGSCGEAATWALYESGLLKISGTGDMYQTFDTVVAPWDSNREDVNSLIIEEGVTSIGSISFKNCTNLASAELPESLSVIGESSFEGCDSLTSITLPSSVTSIGKFAFYSCDSLASVTVPDGVTSIGTNAFSFCNSLTSITLPSSVENLGEGTFNYCMNF